MTDVLHDDDTLLGAALGLGTALRRFVEVAAARGMDRPRVFGIANGMLLAAVDHRLPPTPVGGQNQPPKEET